MRKDAGRSPVPQAGISVLMIIVLATVAAAQSAKPRARRFQLEVFGGAAQAGLSDLNSLAGTDDMIQEFYYDRLFDSQRQAGLVTGWNKSLSGARRTIRFAFPLGLRVRWRLSSSLTISLGARSAFARRESDYSFVYTRDGLDGYERRETVSYQPYLLSSKSLAVLAGAHFARPILRKCTLEAFLAAGPVFADCTYTSSWEYTWHRRGPNEDWDVFQSAGLLEENGRGTGFAADLGARLQYPIGRRLALFLEGVYAHQVVKTVKGKGREVQGDVEAEWEGTWAYKKETIRTPWGSLVTESPTNFWPAGSEASRSRDFRLKASGLQVRLGLSFLF